MLTKYRKQFYLLIIILISLLLTSCVKRTEIEFYKNYVTETDNLSGKLDYIKAGITSYAVYQSKEPFNNDDISMTVYTIEEEKSNVFDMFMLIDPKSNKVVFDFEVNSPGEYQMIIYFDNNKENPIAERIFEVRAE